MCQTKSAGGITWKVTIRRFGTYLQKAEEILAARKQEQQSITGSRCSFFIAGGDRRHYEVYDISLLERMVNCRLVGKPSCDLEAAEMIVWRGRNSIRPCSHRT